MIEGKIRYRRFAFTFPCAESDNTSSVAYKAQVDLRTSGAIGQIRCDKEVGGGGKGL